MQTWRNTVIKICKAVKNKCNLKTDLWSKVFSKWPNNKTGPSFQKPFNSNSHQLFALQTSSKTVLKKASAGGDE